MDFVKENFDGATFPTEGFPGTGVMVHDDAHNFIVGLFKKIPGILAPEVIKTYAAKFAAKLLIELGLRYVVLEGDGQKILKILQQCDSDDSACRGD